MFQHPPQSSPISDHSPLSSMEVVHEPMDVQLAPQEALPAPREAAGNVNALADAVEYIFQFITVVQDDEALQ